MVVEYDGERVEMEEATRREERYAEEGRREAGGPALLWLSRAQGNK